VIDQFILNDLVTRYAKRGRNLVKIEPITARNAIIFRAIRLRALLNAPRAFGSTYAKEIEFNDAEWERRVAKWNGTRGIGFLAMDVATRAAGAVHSSIPTMHRKPNWFRCGQRPSTGNRAWAGN
jgi:hypothetical protein